MRWALLIVVGACAWSGDFAGVDKDAHLYGLPSASQTALCTQITHDYGLISAPDQMGRLAITCGSQTAFAMTEQMCETSLSGFLRTCTATVGDLVDCWDPGFNTPCDYFVDRHTACRPITDSSCVFTGW